MPLSWSNRLESPCKGFEGPHSAPPPTSIGRAIEGGSKDSKRVKHNTSHVFIPEIYSRKYYNNKIITSAQITLPDRVWLYNEYENELYYSLLMPCPFD